MIENGSRKYNIPPILATLLHAIKEHCLVRQGIFRLSGRSGQVAELIESLNQNPLTPIDHSHYGPHEIADVLKKYLRNLPSPLIPSKNPFFSLYYFIIITKLFFFTSLKIENFLIFKNSQKNTN